VPKLPQFTAQLGGAPISGGRAASASDFGADVGAATTALGRTGLRIAEGLKQDEAQRNARDALVGIAQLHQRTAQELKGAELSGGPLDPIREKLQDSLDELRGSMSTNHGIATVDLHSANTLRVFEGQVALMATERAGLEARTKGNALLDSLGTTIAGNPSYLPEAEKLLEGFMQEYGPQVIDGQPAKARLSPQVIAGRTQELIRHANITAVAALSRIDPTGTKARLEAGEFNLTGEQRIQEIGRAETMIEAREARRQNQAKFAAWERQQASEEASDRYLKQIFGNTFNEEEAVIDTVLERVDREHLVVFNTRYWDEKTGTGRKSDQTVLRRMFVRAYAPDDDPSKITTSTPILAAVRDGSLNTADAKQLISAVAEMRDPNNSPIGRQLYDIQNVVTNAFLNDIQYANEKGGKIKAAGIVNAWLFDVRARMDERRQDSKKGAIRDLFNPADKDYVGNPLYIKRFEQAAKGVPTVTSPEERAALPAGTVYQDTAGNVARTPTRVELIPTDSNLPSGGGTRVGGTIR